MSVTRVPERYIPSVEQAERRLWIVQSWPMAGANALCTDECRERCEFFLHTAAENAALAYDLAVSVAHPARREPAWLTQVEDVAW